MTDAIAVCRRILTPVAQNFPTAAAAGCITISISEVVGRKGQDKQYKAYKSFHEEHLCQNIGSLYSCLSTSSRKFRKVRKSNNNNRCVPLLSLWHREI
jgi:hypothetical protein